MIDYLRQLLFDKAQKKVNQLSYKMRGNISDGYHTFNDLYDHRVALFIALCRTLDNNNTFRVTIWKSKKHSDKTEINGWFIMGISRIKGDQISYHLPISKWDECSFAYELPEAPEWDGHTSDDVLKRLEQL